MEKKTDISELVVRCTSRYIKVRRAHARNELTWVVQIILNKTDSCSETFVLYIVKSDGMTYIVKA